MGAWSASASERLHPSSELYHVFPAEVHSVGWDNVEALRSREVSEYGLFQDFSAVNSATLIGDPTVDTTETTEIDTPEPSRSSGVFDQMRSLPGEEETETGAAPSDSTTTTDETDDTAATTTPEDDVAEESAATSTPEDGDENGTESEDSVEAPTESEAEDGSSSDDDDDRSESEEATESEAEAGDDSVEVNDADTDTDTATTSFNFRQTVASVFSRAVGRFPFVSSSTTTEPEAETDDEQAVSTTTEADEESDEAPESETATSAPETQTEEGESNEDEDSAAGDDEDAATARDDEQDEQDEQDDQAEQDEQVEGVATSSPTTTDATPTADARESEDDSEDEEEDVETAVESSFDRSNNFITLRDFGIPSLRSGQTVEMVQLRVSLGSQMESIDPEQVAGLRAQYSVGSFSGDAGTIIFEEETSNAINGGYFLLGLPTVTDTELLHDLEVTLYYEGSDSAAPELYIDSAWLEVSTRSFERQALQDRFAGLKFGHLKQPELSQLVSTERNFSSRELPYFNFRYESQRNFVVRTARQIFGQDLAALQSVVFRHRDIGNIGVEPLVNVTSDGLVSIEVREEDKERLRPGVYTVELEIAEGGRTYTDSFDFQWGLLAANTHQTTYQPEDRVHFSFGALSPNGNTVCDANLELYVVSPDEAVKNVSITPSGLCDGNNVIDVPDYTAAYTADEPGEYEYYLERLDKEGNVMAHMSDTFLVERDQSVTIRRDGPTRIYPPATYTAELTVETFDTSFDGILTEYVPASFDISETDARVTTENGRKRLEWDLTQLASSTQTVSYDFNAPNISPYLFELGAATLTSNGDAERDEDDAVAFTEHRQWQIASDAVGNMIVFWDDAGSIPDGWTCLSCGSGTFFERFVRGGDTYNETGGSETHGHSVDASVQNTEDTGVVEDRDGADIASASHSHDFTPTISEESNLPEYRTLRVIQYTGGAGEPAEMPAGAIAIFDEAVPEGWTRYDVQDGQYIYGADSVGETGGSNTHIHSITGAIEAAGGSTIGSRGGPGQTDAAAAGHTHPLPAIDTDETNHEPPYREVILGQVDADAPPPVGMISMWTEDVPAGWIDVSSAESAPFHDRFIKPSASYGATGGGESHAHGDITGLETGPASAVESGRGGNFGSGPTHTHTVDITDFTEANQLPPYVTAVFGKRIGLDTTYRQYSYQWFANEDDQTPSTPWPEAGSLDLEEQEPITVGSQPLVDGDVVRLRLSATVENATSTAGEVFSLQYATTAEECSAAEGWSTVGTPGSGEMWRGFSNTSVTSGDTLTTTLLASTTDGFTYEEEGLTAGTPVDVPVDGVGEWDFVLQNNGADPGETYCFRLVRDDGSTLFGYDVYPQLVTNSAPNETEQSLRFPYENTADLAPFFEFLGTDLENDDLHYQIQIATDQDFSSVVLNEDSIAEPFDFENRALLSERAPFTSGNLIRYLNDTDLSDDTTYWWRTRARDPDGSDTWGEWVSPDSFTITSTLEASGWLQRTGEQFAGNELNGTEVSGIDSVRLATGETAGTVTTPPIDFAAGSAGTAWDTFRFTDDTSEGAITYQVEYQTEAGEWELIPDSDLSGNESGFTSSPISLLALDVDEYRFIRLVATLENVGGTPHLQEWAVDWGFRVETPEISSLFTNEKVGATTPSFTFSTNDPQENDITYQIEWSTDRTFASGVTTRTSDTDAGFENLNDSGDTDPFTSGDLVQFTVQSADELVDGETYWWRVRGKDTTGADEYSFFTTPRSFTVDTAVTASTWFQTTQEQFQTNTLSGSRGVSGGVTVATDAEEAMIVYGEGNESTPRFRQWDGSTWGDEGSLLSIGSTLRWVVTQAGTTREEYVAATLGSNSNVRAQVFSLGSWDNIVTLTTDISNTGARGFDLAYETVSGNAMVAYCDGGSDPSYRLWDGSSWSGATTIPTSLGADCEWIDLASNPQSNEIVMVVRDSSGDPYEAQVWDGSTWGNATTFGDSRVSAYSGQSVEFTESGSQAVVVTPSGNPPGRFTYNVWDGTAWSGDDTEAINGRLHWSSLASNVGSDELVMCYMDDDSSLGAIRWTGAGWEDDTLFTGAVYTEGDPTYACVYENGGGRDDNILSTYSADGATNFRTFDTTAWSGASTVNTLNPTATMQLARTGVDLILGAFLDDGADALRFSAWDGTGWSATQTLVDDVSVNSTPYGYPYNIAPRNDGSEGSVVVSPPVNFTDGTGPYFETFSWNDDTPGSSSIVYQLQYFDTNSESWEFIPDSDLSGNESGFTTGPVDLSELPVSTYEQIRPFASLSCDGGGSCPTINDWTINWAEGITISGTAAANDRVTDVTDGTVAVAVNGELQSGATGEISSGTWSIDNVTAFTGDVITVYVTGGTESEQAVAVTRYQGTGDITGVALYEQHLTLGHDAPVELDNAAIGSYTSEDTSNIFFAVSGGDLDMCTTSGCAEASLFVQEAATYEPGGAVETHSFINRGSFALDTDLIDLSGAWDNTATSTLQDGTVRFSAAADTYTVNHNPTSGSIFGTLIFGNGASTATWELQQSLDIAGDLTVDAGTLERDGFDLTVAGSLATGDGGAWSGQGTTTFTDSGSVVWSDSNAEAENIGSVVIDGGGKTVLLGGDVAAEAIFIGPADTLDATNNNYELTVFGDWENQNTFRARGGAVNFADTTGGTTITTGNESFATLRFIGADGSWSFTEPELTATADLEIDEGTVTFPTGTTTIGGSFINNATFAHNTATTIFTGSGTHDVTLNGAAFSNSLADVSFTGSGSWTFTDATATTSGQVTIENGSVTMPETELAIGETLQTTGGSIVAPAGAVRFYGDSSYDITLNGSSLNAVSFTDVGSYTWTESDVTLTGDLTIDDGAITFPSNELTLGGSFTNTSSFTAGTSTTRFTATSLGNTVDSGGDAFGSIVFASPTGGWELSSVTATDDVSLLEAEAFTLLPNETLSVGGAFTNQVGGSATEWTDSTLELLGDTFEVNEKTDPGDTYGSLTIGSDTAVSWWNSEATDYAVSGSLYSKDHAGSNGSLHIYGTYTTDDTDQYWRYDLDFDGTDLGTSTRPVNVQLADAATVDLTDVLFDVRGASGATTTVAGINSGTYTINVSGGTTTAEHFSFTDLGASGLSLLASTTVTDITNGLVVPAVDGGSGMTVSSTTINANPSRQFTNVSFATTSPIQAFNVSQTDGVPESFWWFRNGSGNLYGEAFDNDTGDPGSIRWDDSSLVVTLSGTVYADAGETPLAGGVCDGDTAVVTAVVSGGDTYTASCSDTDGSFSIPGVVVVGDPTVTVYVASGGALQAAAVTKTPTGDVTDLDLYQDRVIVRHEDSDPLTVENFAATDSSIDSDIPFTAATGTEPFVTFDAGIELLLWPGKTFVAEADVTTVGAGTGTGHDATFRLATSSTLTAVGTSTLSVGGRFVLGHDAHFVPASSTVDMTATESGKSISAANTTVDFYDLNFTGVGGGWHLGAPISVGADMVVATGTVTGTEDISVPNGTITGDGTLSLGGGTVSLDSGGPLGGSTPWTFSNLVVGSGTTVGTTTPQFSSVTISDTLTIASAHTLVGGSTTFDLTGDGTVLVDDGTFSAQSSTVRYRGAAATVTPTTYYNLTLDALVDGGAYDLTGNGVLVENDLVIGGESISELDTAGGTTLLSVRGDLTVEANGELVGNPSRELLVGGDWTVDGVFTANDNLVRFDGSGAQSIMPGGSPFAAVDVAAAGSVTVMENATATAPFTLTAHDVFTVASGATLALGGGLSNDLGGSATEWSDSTLRFFGGDTVTINASTTNDVYDTLEAVDGTQVRMWNSEAATYSFSDGSLYSQNHENTNGNLAIFGNYVRTSGTDHWSYATDFDGTDLSGSERPVSVSIAADSQVHYQDSSELFVRGASGNVTTVNNQGSGTYALTIGGSATTEWEHVTVRDTDADGLVFTGAPTVQNFSRTDHLVEIENAPAVTVGGTVIDANPAKTFNENVFNLGSGLSDGFNVRATGTSESSWRFTNHTGDLAGEEFDDDPAGDPGYLVWDDSAALITVAGSVYSDEGSTVSSVCDGSTENIQLQVAGVTTYETSCDSATGEYSIDDVSFGPTDTMTLYIAGESVRAANVTTDPVTSLSSMDLYEERVIVRHENVDPITIADLAVWDSSDDADVPFSATTGGSAELQLPNNFKLLVWNDKTFAPEGNISLAASSGATQAGALELREDATLEVATGETHTVAGNFVLGSGAMVTEAAADFVFTSDATGRIIDLQGSTLHSMDFTGAGAWLVDDETLTVATNISIATGAVTFPNATTTIGGDLAVSDGSFDANGGLVLFESASGSRTVETNGSEFTSVAFAGAASFDLLDAAVTVADSFTIASSTVSLPSTSLSVGGDLINQAGDITPGTSELIMTTAATATLAVASADLFSLTIAGGGTVDVPETSLSLLGDLTISDGTLQAPAETTTVGGSFDIAAGTFGVGTSTVLLNGGDTGNIIDTGTNTLHTLQVSAPSGGYTVTSDLTLTNNLTLNAASSWVVEPGRTVTVSGVFTDLIDGADTDWTDTTIVLDGSDAYTINSKSTGAESYSTLDIRENNNIRLWNTDIATPIVAANSSLYSQDHADTNGLVHIYGDFSVGTTTEYWSYERDFDGTDISGSPRTVSVLLESGATTTVTGAGALQIEGGSANRTTVASLDDTSYSFVVDGGEILAREYEFFDLDSDGLQLLSDAFVPDLSFGAFELSVDGGTLITVSSTTVNTNASRIFDQVDFAAASGVSGFNVTLLGETESAWRFQNGGGNLYGEDFDVDGTSECGSIRWDDSTCLQTQQSEVRWRLDDGGEGVPDDEWFDQDWSSRSQIQVVNNDSETYTDAVVRVPLTYESDMNSDFSDLRFTASDGETIISHWTERVSANSEADIWVAVPELPAGEQATIFVYYGNSSASNTSDPDPLFGVVEDFESGSLANFSGEVSEFDTSTSLAFGGDRGLVAVDTEGRTSDGGMYRTDQTVAQGEIIRYKQYVDTADGADDIACTLFGVQAPGSNSNNYGVCINQFNDTIALERDVVFGGSSDVVLASSTVSYETGWYEVEIDWQSDDTIAVTLYDPSGDAVATPTATDNTYSSGGYGFTFWFQHGGWDSLVSYPRITSRPDIFQGVPRSSGGATWSAPQNEPSGSFVTNDTARVRIAVENLGLDITDQNFRLEYVARGSAPSCESISFSEYQPVPSAGSCGDAELCMTDSNFVSHNDSTTNALVNTIGTFVPGSIVAGTNNLTSTIDVLQDQYTELEYVLRATEEASNPEYCLVVSDDGEPLDFYERAAEFELRFDPFFTDISFNDGEDILLSPGTTSPVVAEATVTDLNGFEDIQSATTTVYRSGVSGGADCDPDDNNCYVLSTDNGGCNLIECADNSCTLQCTADVWFHADPTDGGDFEGQEWFAFMEVEDTAGGRDLATPPGVDLLTLRALNVDTGIDYGSLEPNTNTGSFNPVTGVNNIGNDALAIEIEGQDLTDNFSSVIPAEQQKLATSTFEYGSCASCAQLSSTELVDIGLQLSKPTAPTPPVSGDVYWGIEVPFGVNTNPHQGINIFYGVGI